MSGGLLCNDAWWSALYEIPGGCMGRLVVCSVYKMPTLHKMPAGLLVCSPAGLLCIRHLAVSVDTLPDQRYKFYGQKIGEATRHHIYRTGG